MNFIKRTTQFLKSVFFMSDLGVGTDTPTAKVEVVGDMRVRTVTTDNNLTKIVVIDADGNVKSRELSGMAPADKFIQSSTYDPVTNIMTITMTSGVVFTEDLSDLQDELDSKLIDADGDTFVEVERTTDDDTVRFGAGGVDVVTMTNSLVTANEHSNLSAGASLPVKHVSNSYVANNDDSTLIIDQDTYNPGFNHYMVTLNLTNLTNSLESISVPQSQLVTVEDFITISGGGSYDGTYEVFSIDGNLIHFVSSLSGNATQEDLSNSIQVQGISDGTMSLPLVSTLTDGKVFEIKPKVGSVISVDGTSYINGFGQTFNFDEQQTTYLKVQANHASDSYIVVEQDRTFGDLIDTTAPNSGLTFTDTKLVGLTANDVDVWRDGLLEMNNKYAIDAATGTMNVIEAFQEETLKIRLT